MRLICLWRRTACVNISNSLRAFTPFADFTNYCKADRLPVSAADDHPFVILPSAKICRSKTASNIFSHPPRRQRCNTLYFARKVCGRLSLCTPLTHSKLCYRRTNFTMLIQGFRLEYLSSKYFHKKQAAVSVNVPII